MRRTSAITVAASTAAALALSACGRAPTPRGAATDRQGRQQRQGHRHHHRLGHGRRGRQAPDAGQGVRGRQPRRQGQGHRDPVGRRARQVHHRHHGRQDPRRRHGRHHLDGRVRRHRRPRPDARPSSTRPSSSTAPGRPPRWTAPPTASPGTSRRGWSTTAPTWPRRPAGTTPPTDWEGLKAMAKAMQDKAGAKYGIGLQAGGTGSWQTRHAVRVVQRRRAHQGRRQGLQLRHPGDARGARVLQDLLHRRDLRQGRPGDADAPRPASPAARSRCSSPARGRCPRSRRPAARASRTSTPSRRCPAKQDRPRRSSAAATSRSSRTPRTATPPGSSSSGSPTPRRRRSGTSRSTDLPVGQDRVEGPGDSAADPKLAVFGEQLKTAQAPPAFPTWEQVVSAFDSEIEKVTKPAQRPGGRAEDRADSRPSRSAPARPTMTTDRARTLAAGLPRPAEAGAATRRPAAGPPAGGAGRLGPRPAVLPAVPGLHRWAGASSRSS